MSPFCFQPEDTSHVFIGINMEAELYTRCLWINVVQYFNEKMTVPGLQSAAVWCHAIRRIGPSTMWHPSTTWCHIQEDHNLHCSTVTTASMSNLTILPKYTTNISTATLADKLIRLWGRRFQQRCHWRFESPGQWHCALVQVVPDIMYEHTNSILSILDRASSWELNIDRPTWCHLFYYFTIYCSTCFEC